MPSLRRTLSSPSVRSSPYAYPASSSSSSLNAHSTRAANPQPRRSSGSDTSNRRVLADLDWWVVQDGQHPYATPSVAADGEGENSEEQVAAEAEQARPLRAPIAPPVVAPPPTASPLENAAQAFGGFTGDFLSSPLWDFSPDGSMGSAFPEDMSPLSPFASLSLAPRTPMRRHASESSQSSVDSSPETNSSFPLPTYMDVLRPAAPAYPSVFVSSIGLGRPSGRAPPLTARSVSYSAVEFQLSSARVHDSRFEDIVPMPPPFFSSTMGESDVDDLFFE